MGNFEQNMYYNIFIRFYLESFLETNTSAYINLFALSFTDKMNILCSVLSIFVVCISLVFPLANGLLLYQFKEKLENGDLDIKYQFGALYEEYNLQKWY